MTLFDEGMESLSILTELYDFNMTQADIGKIQITAAYLYETTGDLEYLEEGFSDMITSIVESIKRLIESIKEFFVKIFRALASMGMDYKQFVKSYEKELKEARPNFTYKGFTFAGIWKNPPSMEEFQKTIDSYNETVADLAKVKIDDVTNEITKWLEADNIEHIRAKVLGVQGKIEEADFSEEVRKFYRGSKDEEDIKVDSSYVSKLISNVDNVYKLKDKAEKDRNAIVAMLAKTETFFSRKADVVYKGSTKYLDTRTLEYDKEKYKIDSKESRTEYSEQVNTNSVKLINAMYQKVRVLSGIINICITERSIAFKDYVKQCRKILGQAVTGKTDAPEDKAIKEEGYEILNGEITEEALDYVKILEEGRLLLQNKEIRDAVNAQYQIVQHAVACFECGIITEPVMEGIIADAIEAIKNFFTNLVGMFRKKQVENIQKYEPWYTDQEIIDEVSAKVSPDREFTLYPLWNGNYGNETVGKISALLRDVMVKPNDPSKCNWAKEFTDIDTIADLNTNKNVKTRLKNYFMVGKPEDKVSSEKVSGSKLQNLVPKMFEYMRTYKDLYKGVDPLDSKVKNMRIPSFVNDKETATAECLRLLDMTGCLLMEADAGDQPKASANEVRNVGASDAQKNGTQASGKVEETDESKEGAKAEKKNAEKTSNNTDVSLEKYVQTGIKFSQNVIAAYMTSLEERYTAYWKVLSLVAPDDCKPIFKEGIYQGTKKTGLFKKVKEKVTGNKDMTEVKEAKQKK